MLLIVIHWPLRLLFVVKKTLLNCADGGSGCDCDCGDAAAAATAFGADFGGPWSLSVGAGATFGLVVS